MILSIAGLVQQYSKQQLIDMIKSEYNYDLAAGVKDDEDEEESNNNKARGSGGGRDGGDGVADDEEEAVVAAANADASARGEPVMATARPVMVGNGDEDIGGDTAASAAVGAEASGRPGITRAWSTPLSDDGLE